MTQQSHQAVPPKLPLPIAATAVWLSLFALFTGFPGTLMAVLVSTHNGPRRGTLAMFYTNPAARHFLLPMFLLMVFIVSVSLADIMKKRMKPRYRPVPPPSAKRRRRRNLAILLLFYAAVYGPVLGSINPARIDWTGFAVCLALLLIGWQGSSWFSEMLPKAPPLAVDPLESSYVPISSARQEQDVTDWRAGGKSAPSGLWLVKTNARTLVSESPKALRNIFYVLSGISLLGSAMMVWLNGHVRPQVRFEVWFTFVLCLLGGMMLTSLAAPQRLEIDLVGGTYRYTDWRVFKPRLNFAYVAVRWPFVTETTTGVLAEDFQGVGVTSSQKGCSVLLTWRDPERVPINVGGAATEEKARLYMEEAVKMLGLPALGRIPLR